MCIGITVILLPPTVLGAGYVSWYQGHVRVLVRYDLDRDDAPSESFGSFTSGMLTLGGSYYMQSKLIFPMLEGGGGGTSSSSSSSMKEFKKHAFSRTSRSPSYYFNKTLKQQPKGNSSIRPTPGGTMPTPTPTNVGGGSGGYVPPQSIGELAKRIAPPLLLRISAASMAFFFAGAVQTYVAVQSAEQQH